MSSIILYCQLIVCIILNLVVPFYSIFHTSIPNPFPPPKYPEGNRTAVILSGQLRVGNVSILSPNVVGYLKTNIRKFFGSDDPPTPIATHLEHFIQILARHGGVDLFIYFEAAHRDGSIDNWNGDPETYEPVAGDTRPCELYSSSPIFAESTGNRVFCLVEEPRLLNNIFIRDFRMWDNFFYHQVGAESFLRQLYGIYTANLASKEHSKATKVQYRFKARLRTDTAFVMPFPQIERMKFGQLDSSCPGKAVLYPNYIVFGNSAEDSFLFGEAQDMNYVLDRYINVIAEPYDMYYPGRVWFAERHLKFMLMDLHGICLLPNLDIYMIKIMKTQRGVYIVNTTWNHETQWVEMTKKSNISIPIA